MYRYTTQALRQDLLRVRNAWEECRASRDRDAIYLYLTVWNELIGHCGCRVCAHSTAKTRLPQSFAALAVFDLVSWWAAESCALERAYKSLRLQSMCPFDGEDPFAAVIRCTGCGASENSPCRGLVRWSNRPV